VLELFGTFSFKRKSTEAVLFFLDLLLHFGVKDKSGKIIFRVLHFIEKDMVVQNLSLGGTMK